MQYPSVKKYIIAWFALSVLLIVAGCAKISNNNTIACPNISVLYDGHTVARYDGNSRYITDLRYKVSLEYASSTCTLNDGLLQYSLPVILNIERGLKFTDGETIAFVSTILHNDTIVEQRKETAYIESSDVDFFSVRYPLDVTINIDKDKNSSSYKQVLSLYMSDAELQELHHNN